MEKTIFNKFREIVYTKSGISLNDGKESLVVARVGKRMRTLGFDDYKKYLSHITSDETGTEIVRLLDAISTNVTSFFRESDHFEFLRELFLKSVAKGQRRFRIWSSACSTGEEPYSIAMKLLSTSNMATEKLDMRILASDISTEVLNSCLKGVYSKDKIDSIPENLKRRFLRKISKDEESYAIEDSIKKMVVFKRINLINIPFPMRGPMDAIFCRNVMIYFDNALKKRLMNEFWRLLKPGGYLFVGHAESLAGMLSDFKSVRPAIYAKQ